MGRMCLCGTGSADGDTEAGSVAEKFSVAIAASVGLSAWAIRAAADGAHPIYVGVAGFGASLVICLIAVVMARSL